MPKNDPQFYDRAYCKLFGFDHVPKSKMQGVYDICDHPVFYFRMFYDMELFSILNKLMRKTENTNGSYPRNQCKIPLTVLRPQGLPREEAIVCMRAKDFNALHKDNRAGESERESYDEWGYLEWALPELQE